MSKRANHEGTIYESPEGSGIWYAQLSPGPDGKRPKRRASSQRDARLKLKQLIKEREQGVDLSLKQPTVIEWCNTWLSTFARNLKVNIRDDYQGVINRYIKDTALGNRRLDKLTPAEVQAWVNDLGTRIAALTVRGAHARLHTALECAVQNSYVTRNVAHGIKLPPMPKTEINPFDFRQTQMLLDAVAEHRWYALYLLAVTLGMREAELFGLTWPAIDFEAGTLRVFQQLRRGYIEEGKPRAFILQTVKTNAGLRTLQLDDTLLAALRKHRALQAEERLLLGAKWRDPWGNLVFTTETGGPIHATSLLDHFKQVLAAADLPRIRFHDLRHTAATLMLADGAPLVTVSKILGHSSPAVTANIYAHALDESKAGVISRLSQRLKKD